MMVVVVVVVVVEEVNPLGACRYPPKDMAQRLAKSQPSGHSEAHE